MYYSLLLDLSPYIEYNQNKGVVFMDMSRMRTKKTVGERLKELRLQKNITQQEAANALKISRSALGRFENDLQELTGDSVVQFADYYGISCDTLLRGVEDKHYKIHQVTGLDAKSIEWLNKIKNGNPEMTDIINNVLGHNDIAEPLFEAFYIYAWLKIPEFVQYDDGTIMGRVSRSLSDEETLLKSVMADYIHEILVQVRNSNKKARFKQSEEKMRSAIEKLQKEMEDKKKKNKKQEHLHQP